MPEGLNQVVLKLIIEDDEGRKEVIPFVRDEMTVGRQEGNTIRLQERNVSRRHARLSRQNGHLLVEDLGSYNGIRVNGERIFGKISVHDGDLIQIGDYEFAVQADTNTNELPPPGPATTSGEFSAVSSTGEVSTDSNVETVITQLGSDPREQTTAIIRVDQIDSAPRAVEDVPLEEAPRLVVLNTELAGQELTCLRSQVTMGRAEENDFPLEHRSLSRFHAKLARSSSGDWQIFDLQSANGVTVNGETYAQATLRSGDVVGMGHVQIKFLSPGEVARFSRRPELAPRATALKVGRKWRAQALGGLVVCALVLAAYFGLMRPKTEVAIVEEQPPTVTAPSTPSKRARALDETLAAAREALSRKDLDEAQTLLQSVKPADRTHDFEGLQDRIRAERLAKETLAGAGSAMDRGDLPLAQRLLSDSEGTEVFAAELNQQRARLKQLKEQSKPDSKKPASKKEKPTAPSSPEAPTLYAEGYTYYRTKQYAEAAQSFSRCLEADPSFASCHLLLGSTYAKMKNTEKGAYHYRQFVKLAPDDEQTPKIRKMLEQYEASVNGQP